jgi:cell wall-associated NlpC family hydrolase
MKTKLITALVALMLFVSAFSTNAYADYYSDYTTLYAGMRSSSVTDLQKDLKSLGYFSYSATGYFGDLTRQAVVRYQQDRYLVADGIVGHGTARKLKVDQILQTARSYMGVPYVWGGVSPSGFDCSGFTHYVFYQNGIVIPRNSADQYQQGTWVAKSQLLPGDLVFFETYKPGPSHVGIYMGGGKFIHASSGAEKVTISELGNPYYVQHYIGAKRVIR